MSLTLACLVFVFGLGIVLFSAEQLVDAVERTSRLWGVSAFVVTVVLVGFDPENLFVGAAGTYEEMPGLAMGSILGALMVAVALAFGLTVCLVPLEFEEVFSGTLLSGPAAAALTWALSADGVLSRLDGAVLLGGFGVAIYFLYSASRRGLDLKPPEISTATTTPIKRSGTRATLVLLGSLGGVILGSEMVVLGARPVFRWAGLSDTVFGMTVLALLVSIEELARELPAAMRGRPDITVGNVIGSVIHFLLLNAGLIALVRPVRVDTLTLSFYFPVVLVTLVVVVLFLIRRRVHRLAGLVLIGLYVLFVTGPTFL